MKKIKLDKKILCLLLIDVILCLFLFFWKMPRGHDLTFHLSRIQGLADTMKSGSFYAPIHMGLYGYGYANGLFYCNLFLYLPALLVEYGVPVLTAYKILIILINIATSLVMYYTMRKVTNNDSISFITSILYTTCCYRITDIAIRAALGESLAYIFVPLIILGLYEMINGDYKKWYLFTLGFIFTLQSHLITTLIMFIICAIIILFNIKKIIKEKRLKYFIYSIIIGICLSAYFIFPFLEQYFSDKFIVNTQTLTTEPWLRAIGLKDIFIENFFIMNTNTFTPVGVGIVFIIISILRFKIKEKDKLMKMCDLCLISGFICLICTTNIFPWKLFGSLLSSIQFPWRMYLPSTLFLSISSGIILENLLINNKERKKFISLIVIYVTFIGLSVSFYSFIKIYDGYYYDIGAGEYLPQGTSQEQLKERGEVVTSNNDELIYYYDKNNLSLDIKYVNNQKDNTYLEVPLLYYKGYKAISLNDEREYKIEKGENNIVKINISNSEDHIKIYYGKTTIQKISIVITLVTFLTLICLGLKKGIKYEKVF